MSLVNDSNVTALGKYLQLETVTGSATQHAGLAAIWAVDNAGTPLVTMDRGLQITGTLAISSIAEVASDVDKFLCSDNGTVKYVDGANLATYIGAVSTSANNTFTGNNTFSGKLSGSNGISVTDGGGTAVMTLNDTGGYDLTVASATINSNTAITGTLNTTGAATLESTLKVNGATTLDGTLTSNGAATLSSAKVSDLTDNRVVIAGTAGELEDDANLTFDGTTLLLGSSQDVKARTFVTYSDATLKTDIKPLNNALDKVMSMRGVTYEFKSESSAVTASPREIGFLAQEMKNSVPEVVYGSGNGNLGIDYAKLTSVLVEAIKDQQSQIEELRAALLKK